MINIAVTNGKRTAPIGELHGWKDNPRDIEVKDLERLKKQISLGEYKPILVMTDGTVLGGNMRLKAYKELGIENIWVSEISFKEYPDGRFMSLVNGHPTGKFFDSVDQLMLEYALSDNDRAGYYIDTKLQELIELSPIDMTLYNADFAPPVPLDLALAEESQLETEEDIAPEVADGEAISKRGEVYQLGNHRLMCGDSTVYEDLKILMQNKKANMVFTDPPYLMGFTGNVHADGSKSHNASHGEILNDNMSREDGQEFVNKIFENIKAWCYGAYYVSFYRLGLDYVFSAMAKASMEYKALIIWNKGNHTLSNSDYMSKYEPIVYGWVNAHNFYGAKGSFDIWDIPRTQKNDLHPTMKPIALCAKAIDDSSKEGDVVLDMFGGSGSTLIACEQINRVCNIMELDPKYCDVIRKRYANLVSDGEEWEELTKQITAPTA